MEFRSRPEISIIGKAAARNEISMEEASLLPDVALQVDNIQQRNEQFAQDSGSSVSSRQVKQMPKSQRTTMQQDAYSEARHQEDLKSGHALGKVPFKQRAPRAAPPDWVGQRTGEVGCKARKEGGVLSVPSSTSGTTGYHVWHMKCAKLSKHDWVSLSNCSRACVECFGTHGAFSLFPDGRPLH